MGPALADPEAHRDHTPPTSALKASADGRTGACEPPSVPDSRPPDSGVDRIEPRLPGLERAGAAPGNRPSAPQGEGIHAFNKAKRGQRGRGRRGGAGSG